MEKAAGDLVGCKVSAPLRISLLKHTNSQGKARAEEMTRDNNIQFGKAISQAAKEEELNVQEKSSVKDLEKQGLIRRFLKRAHHFSPMLCHFKYSIGTRERNGSSRFSFSYSLPAAGQPGTTESLQAPEQGTGFHSIWTQKVVKIPTYPEHTSVPGTTLKYPAHNPGFTGEQ